MCVLPVPVWPYAKMVAFSPRAATSRTAGETKSNTSRWLARSPKTWSKLWSMTPFALRDGIESRLPVTVTQLALSSGLGRSRTPTLMRSFTGESSMPPLARRASSKRKRTGARPVGTIAVNRCKFRIA